MSMDEPQPDAPDGFDDGGILDRSQQAARFLDLTRQHGLVDDDDDDVLPSLLTTRLLGGADDRPLLLDGLSDPPGAGLGGFTLDDDGDVFGDGNGFGIGIGFGSETD